MLTDYLPKQLLKTVLILLIAVCIFDPADLAFGLKVPLFVLLWLFFLIDVIFNNKALCIKKGLAIYLALFFLILSGSFLRYIFSHNPFEYYAGVTYLKPYLFVSIVVVMYISKIDPTKPFVFFLTVLSFATIMMVFAYHFEAVLFWKAHEFLQRYMILAVGPKKYGRFILLDVPAIFFHTSKLLPFSIAYFTAKLFDSRGIERLKYLLMAAINIAGMFIGASRSSIVFSILTPVLVFSIYSKRGKYIFTFFAACTFIILMRNMSLLMSAAFNPLEQSNMYKISFLKDYVRIFSNIDILFFGQGIGSYFNTSIRGFVSLTELTFFEFIRVFGLILGVPLIVLIFYPLSRLRDPRYKEEKYVYIAYLVYLAMSFVNPIFVSSSGMLFLSLVVYKFFAPHIKGQIFEQVGNMCSH